MNIIKYMNGGDDPSVKRKLLRNIKSKYIDEKIPSKRFIMMQGKSYKKYNKRSPLKNEIVKESIEPEIKMEQATLPINGRGTLKSNSYTLTSLQNIKKLKKEYIRKGGDDLNFLEKLNKKEKELEKELFDNLESDFIKSNSFIFDTNQSGSGKARLTEEQKEARRKYQAEWVKNKLKNLTEEQKKARNEYQVKLAKKKMIAKKMITETLLDLSKCTSTQSGSGKIRSQYHGRTSSIMVKVPENVKNTALYSFKLKKLGFGGGLETGWKRAKQLSTKSSISIQDLRYMRAWFARHIYTSYPTYKKWLKAGRPKTKEWHRKHGIISWLIWSGDAGLKWVNSQKNINLLNKHYNKNYKRLKLK